MATVPVRLRHLLMLENEELNKLLKMQHRNCLVKFLNEHEIDELWSIVFDAFKTHVDNLTSAALTELPQNNENGEKLTATEDFISSVLHLVRETVFVKDDPYVPESLTDILLALQAFLCNPAVPGNVQRATAELFVDLCEKRFLQPAECVNVLQYYLKCAFNETSRLKWKTDIHKLWQLRSLLTKINVRSDALKSLKNLLQRCTASEKFLICEDGQQFLTALLGADDLLLQEFISLMEENMPRKNKEAAVGYSKLLVHAWVKGSGSQKEVPFSRQSGRKERIKQVLASSGRLAELTPVLVAASGQSLQGIKLKPSDDCLFQSDQKSHETYSSHQHA